ncbi:hypothetical protein TrVGV298_002206 [Trichoderma virens]|nr:hypothetical protein TrVGV298_002206 [Trichoderma virens]
MNGSPDFELMSDIDDYDSMSDWESVTSNASTDIDMALAEVLSDFLSNPNEERTMLPSLDLTMPPPTKDIHRNEYTTRPIPLQQKAVTEQMKATFPALRLVLQIGVGAGISGAQANIHLGDMLINRSNKSYNKALRYDDEKSIISAYELDASLNAPPQFISNPIMKLNEPGTRSSSTTIPRQNLPSNLYHSNQSDIVLFEAHYNHIERGGGLQCDFARQIYEEEMTGWPVENYGTTGLNNQVMEDVAARSDVFYFEMESSGIATSFLCLVIRAIYNYSDSISCKKRQPCKWGIASLFAKELLSIISRDELAEINSVGEFAKAIAKIRNIENNWDNNIRELGGLEHCCG